MTRHRPAIRLFTASRSRLRLSYLLPFVLLAGLGCDKTAQHQQQAPKPAEVVVTSPVSDEVADYQDFTGRLDGLKTVDIRCRVSGFIMSAPFKEGDLVREGELLFQIDQRPYQAALNQAEANLKLAEADRNLQSKNAQRARVMFGNHTISREDYDTMIAADEKSKANVGALEAARDLAKLNLDYTHVTSPLSGRVSRRQVDPGNLVTADNTVLTTVVSDQELYGYFDVDERTYLDLLGPGRPAQDTWATNLEFPVLMSLANEAAKFEHVGHVNFIDNRVNASTGTIRMRGVFPNPKGLLKSGLFVRIRLPLSKPYKTLVLSAEALQSDQGRSFVYVVNDKNEVEYRKVTVGQEIHGLRVIREGLALGDRVIVSGMQRVRPGAKVEAKVQPPPKTMESPLVKLLRGEPAMHAGKAPPRPEDATRPAGGAVGQ